MPEQGTIPFSIMDDLCHTLPFALKGTVYWVIERSTNPSIATNRYPIVDILCLISVEMVFNSLSNIRLLGMDTNPQATASLSLY